MTRISYDGSMNDAASKLRTAVVERALHGDGTTTPADRRAAFDNRDVPEAGRALIDKITKGEGRCMRAALDADVHCDARVVLLGGIDTGVALVAYDAPPELSSTDDALLYWGPLGRARVAVRASWPTPSGNELGVTVGAGLAITSAHYMTTASGTGLRLEPELDVSAAIGF